MQGVNEGMESVLGTLSTSLTVPQPALGGPTFQGAPLRMQPWRLSLEGELLGGWGRVFSASPGEASSP